MLTFTPQSFADTLAAAASTQTNWSGAMVAALGSSRQLVGLRNGVEFYRSDLTGAMVINGGRITYLGKTANVTKNLAADLSTGTCVLRIEGGSNVVNASLGLAGSGADFILSASPDGVSSLAFSASASLGPYQFLPTGVGPGSPVKSDDMYHTVELWDWTDPANPVLASSVTLNTREANFSLQNAVYAQDYGDVAVWSSSASLTIGNLSAQALMTIADKSCTETGINHLQQLRLQWKYNGAWANFPEATSFNMKTMILNLPPHKVLVKDKNGVLKYTMEHHTGVAINAASLVSGKLGPNPARPDAARDATHPIDPQMHVFREHYCENTRPRVTTRGPDMLTPFRNYRPSMGKSTLSSLDCEPLLSGGYQKDSLIGAQQMFYMPKYAEPAINVTVTGDPYLENNERYKAFQTSNITGWGQSYGAFGGMNRYRSPGGPRFDRALFPSVYAMYFNDPNGSRLLGNVPWAEMAHAWRWNIYNDTTPHGIALSDVDNWALTGFYYWNGNPPGSAKTFRLNANMRDGTSLASYDNAGNVVMGGDGTDILHDYKHRGVQAILWVDPMAALCATDDTIYSFITHGSPAANKRRTFMVRAMAWEWKTYGLQWTLGSNHPRGISQAYIEARFATLLESNYRDNIKPAFVDNEQSIFGKGLRNLGTNLELDNIDSPGATPTFWNTTGGHLGYYMTDVLIMFRQTEFWHQMMAKGGNGAMVMTKLVECFDKYTTGQILDFKGMNDGGYTTEPSDGSLTSVPESWADLLARKTARNDPDLVNDFQHSTNFDVNPRTYGNYGADTSADASIFESWAHMRSFMFLEIPSPRNAAAIAEFDRWDSLVAAKVAAASTPRTKQSSDYTYRLPCNSPRLAPVSGFIGRA